MHCEQCGLWELGAGDLVCAWCGASYLRFAVSVTPEELSTEDYPPPVELRVRNESPLGTLTLERIETGGVGWIALLPDPPLPQTLAPGAQQTFFLDVDTFAAGAERQAVLAVNALYAPEARTAVLRLRQSTQAGS